MIEEASSCGLVSFADHLLAVGKFEDYSVRCKINPIPHQFRKSCLQKWTVGSEWVMMPAKLHESAHEPWQELSDGLEASESCRILRRSMQRQRRTARSERGYGCSDAYVTRPSQREEAASSGKVELGKR